MIVQYIIDDKNFEINSLELPCTGDLKTPHTPIGTCKNAIKNDIFEFCFDCGKNVFQWTKKEPPRSFWLELYRFSVPYTVKYTKYEHFMWKSASEAKSDAKGSKVVNRFVWGSFGIWFIWFIQHILTIIDT